MPVKKNFKAVNPALSYIETDINQLDADTHADTSTHESNDNYAHTHNYADVDTVVKYNLPGDHVLPDQRTEDLFVVSTSLSNYSPLKRHRESKSRRLQLLIKPSTYAGISQLADNNDTSVNDIINTILEEYLRRENN